MRKITLTLLLTALLAGCSAGQSAPQSDPPPQEPPAPVAEPAADREEIFVDDPASPYPMTVENWSLDLDGDGIEATLDEETMTSQVTVPETGCTETLDLMEWLELQTKRNREHGYDSTFEPHYDETGVLTWPAAPGNIDGCYHAEQADEGLTLRQYIWGSAHVDGMGALVTTLSWENGEAVVLNQYFDWD